MIVNIATGLLGLALLVASVLLLNVLPHKDVPPNEFRVSFLSMETNLTAVTHNFTESSNNYDFQFNVTDDDVYEVEVQASFTDNIAASAPDRFTFEIYRQDGESADSKTVAVVNPVAAAINNATDAYKPMPATATHVATLTPKPQDAIVSAIQGATAQDVERALEQRNHLITKGTWKVHVTLIAAGDCGEGSPPRPPLPPSQDDAQRFATCQREAQGVNGPDAQKAGLDFGNEFTVGVFSYTRFVVHAEKFG